MVGGANYHRSQFNLATQGERQPGSSFKPFVLATALKEGIAPSSILTSSKHVTINADGRLWQVNNFEGEALGPIDLAKAIAYSDNSVFAQLTALVGPRQRRSDGGRARDPEPQGLLRDRPRRRAGDAARDGARLHRVRQRRRAHRRLDLRQQSRARSTALTDAHGVCSEQNRAVTGKQVLTTHAGRDDRPAAAGRHPVRHRQGGSDPRLAGRRQDRHDGELRRCVVRRLHAAATGAEKTHQLVAVWVGYPNKLVPMLTEFHGHPVAGGTFPALIWKAFMQKAIALEHLTPRELHASAVAVRGAGHGRQPRRRCSSATTASATTPTSSRSSAAPARRGSRRASRTRSRSRT